MPLEAEEESGRSPLLEFLNEGTSSLLFSKVLLDLSTATTEDDVDLAAMSISDAMAGDERLDRPFLRA